MLFVLQVSSRTSTKHHFPLSFLFLPLYWLPADLCSFSTAFESNPKLSYLKKENSVNLDILFYAVSNEYLILLHLSVVFDVVDHSIFFETASFLGLNDAFLIILANLWLFLLSLVHNASFVIPSSHLSVGFFQEFILGSLLFPLSMFQWVISLTHMASVILCTLMMTNYTSSSDFSAEILSARSNGILFSKYWKKKTSYFTLSL